MGDVAEGVSASWCVWISYCMYTRLTLWLTLIDHGNGNVTCFFWWNLCDNECMVQSNRPFWCWWSKLKDEASFRKMLNVSVKLMHWYGWIQGFFPCPAKQKLLQRVKGLLDASMNGYAKMFLWNLSQENGFEDGLVRFSNPSFSVSFGMFYVVLRETSW